MRYRLRTLLIFLVLGPPVLAGAWFAAREIAALASLPRVWGWLIWPLVLAPFLATLVLFSRFLDFARAAAEREALRPATRLESKRR